MFKSRSSIWISVSNSPSIQELRRHRIESPDAHAPVIAQKTDTQIYLYISYIYIVC